MAAVGDTSKQIAQQKQSSGELATKADIQEMLNKALEKRGIADQTTYDAAGKDCWRVGQLPKLTNFFQQDLYQ